MIERKSYVGKLNGVSGVWCDQKPEGLEVIKENTFYVPDEGKIFVDKDGNMLDCVVITDGVDIKDFVEIKQPKGREDESSEM